MKKLSHKRKQQQVRRAAAGNLPAFKDRRAHSLLQIKDPPDIWIAFRQELNSGRHQDIVDACSDLKTFEESMGEIAARLDIALDGAYDPVELASVLYAAMKRRNSGAIQNHKIDSRLVPVELVERENTMTLESLADLDHAADDLQLKLKEAPADEGRYTICNSCDSSFDCISNRTCRLGRPAVQLGNTIRTLNSLSNLVKH